MLDRVKKQILEYINELDDVRSLEIYNKIEHGKMLRSKLLLKIAGDTTEAIKSCAVIEMIHLASLLHDDVIDKADIRRNKPSINAIYGEHTAIMFGDILYSKAFSELAILSSDIAYEISSAVTKLSIGEMLDVELGKKFNTSTKMYFDMIYKKTSALIEASAVVGAKLSNKDVKNFQIYGKNLGVAFQIVDDILDIVSSDEVLGKPAMNDLKEGKVTLPYLYFYIDGDQKDKDYIVSKFKKELSSNEKKELKEKLIKSKAITKAKEKVKKIANIAIDAISYEDNSDLIDIINSMINREF